MGGSLSGQLLVSRPDMTDPNFDGTITFILEHGDEGAVGVVLNRPSSLAVSDPFPDWEDLAGQPPVLFHGGPVQANAIIALGRYRTDSPPDGTVDLPCDLVSIDLDEQPALLRGAGLVELRIFAGYAGWGNGQLEEEIRVGAWWLLPGSADDVFTRDPRHLWTNVLQRGGGELRWFAHLPLDPTAN